MSSCKVSASWYFFSAPGRCKRAVVVALGVRGKEQLGDLLAFLASVLVEELAFFSIGAELKALDIEASDVDAGGA